jgi:hypothetical protein
VSLDLALAARALATLFGINASSSMVPPSLPSSCSPFGGFSILDEILIGRKGEAAKFGLPGMEGYETLFQNSSDELIKPPVFQS